MTSPQRFSEFGWTLFGTAVLAAVLAAAAGLTMAGGADHPRKVEAVGFAAAVCLFGACGSWIIARWPTANPALGVAKSLGAITLRLFLPLVALGWLLQSAGGELQEAGAARFLLSFYLPLLAADILLHIIGSQNRPRISGKKRVN